MASSVNNPFSSPALAVGYANARPPVHERILEQARLAPAEYGLDIGCGAGVSTRALARFARRCIGMEPAAEMLQWHAAVAPGAEFLAAAAEAMPLASRSIDLMTAAGSLNYVDLDRFFPEVRRVLKPAGRLLVYDFSPGQRFSEQDDELTDWFRQFQKRYPPAPGEARELNPKILAEWPSGLRWHSGDRIETALPLTPGFYLDYMMTETNVAAALRRGVMHGEIKSWCRGTLATVWPGGPRAVTFRGYYACFESA